MDRPTALSDRSAQPRRPRADNRHSRAVALLKIVLPLAAIGLLATLFLVPGEPGREAAHSPDSDALEQIREKRLLRGPVYTAVTETGGALTVTADTATPRAGETGLFDMTDLAVTLEPRSGGETTLDAQSGVIDGGAEAGVFRGRVQVATADGYRLETEELSATLDGRRAESTEPVRLEGPRFYLEAGAMEIDAGPNDRPGSRVVFKEGVRLVYTATATPSGANTD